MIKMYLRIFLFQMRKGFVNLILGWVSLRLALDYIFLGSYWKAKGAWERSQPLVERGPRGPWGSQILRKQLRDWVTEAEEVQREAPWQSFHPGKASKETWAASFLHGSWNVDSVIFHQQWQRGKVVQLCNPFNSDVTLSDYASHSSDPWLGSPEIRRVPIERILSEAVRAPIRNKENRLYQPTAGNILQQF